MGDILPTDLQTVAPSTLPNRRDFLKKTGTIAGLTSAGAFTQLLPGSTAEAQYNPTPSVKPMIATPNQYDLRKVGGSTNYITEVRDQGICNACTAFAVIGAIEGAISVKANTPNPQLHLSEEQLFSCAGPGCDTNAWYPADALAYCQNFGVTNYANYGPRDGVCHSDPNASPSPVKISSYQKLANAAAMKQCISGTGAFTSASPVVSLFVFYQDLWDWAPNSDNKVYKHKDNGNPHDEGRIGGHAVCIVGYDDNPGFWICKNSWGPSWGGAGKGYFNMSYGDCHIDDFEMYGVVAL
jgi:C1A family cysteine protease